MENNIKYGALVYTHSNGIDNQLIDEVHYGYYDTKQNDMPKGADIEYYADDDVPVILNKLDNIDLWLEQNNYKVISVKFEEVA